MASETILLPGEEIQQDQLPKSKKGTLTLGPGLRHIPPSTILSTTSGSLHTDQRKAASWLEAPHGRYLPSVGDLVVAQIHHSSTETYHCGLTPHTSFALLGQLAFEGANKKTRPKLENGDLVYARVSRASKFEDTEIECVNPSSGKADGLGPLTGGMVFNVSPAFARRLMMGTDKDGRSKGGVVTLEEVSEKVKFEVAVGRNGRIWVDSGSVRTTAMIGRLLTQADEAGWSIEEQRKAVRKSMKDV
jgi:exosome complex component RRP40